MPKTVINSSDWDQWVQALYRTGNERVLAVFKLGDGSRLEVLTVPNDDLLETRGGRS